MGMLEIIGSGIRQGLLLVPLAVGVHIAFRFARYPDLTPDGSVVIGGAITWLAVIGGFGPVSAILAGMLAGGALGAVTALTSEVFGIDRVLAGIASSLLAYSITLRLLGRGNVSLPAIAGSVFGSGLPDVLVIALAAGTVVLFTAALAHSRLGLRLRAVGENRELVDLLGGNSRLRIAAGLFWANATVALTGGLLVEYQRFADVGQGAGTLFSGLACLLIGSALPLGGRLLFSVSGSAGGAILYSCMIAGALRTGLRPGDLKAMTAALVIGTAWLGSRLLPEGERVPLFE